MEFQQPKDHWFSFRDACVFVMETFPSRHDPLQFPIFFLHGRFGHSQMWIPIAESFSQQTRCLIADLPGFGKSFCVRDRGFSLLEHVSLMNELIQELVPSQQQLLLVAHDVGGAIAMLCALKYPEKIKALVLINSAGVTRELSRVLAGIFGRRTHRKLEKLLKAAVQMKQELRASLRIPWNDKSTQRTLLNSIRAFDDSWPLHYERLVWKSALKNLTQPVLLLWGQKDELNPPDIAVELMQQLPEAYFFMDENSGHWPCLEQPQWVLSKMKEFIFRMNYSKPMNVQRSLWR